MLSQEKVRYIDHKVNISEEEKEKLCSAIDNNEGVTIRFKHKDLMSGDNLISFTEQQFKRLANAFDKGRGLTIKMSEDQVKQHEIVADAGGDEDDYFLSPFV